ncbi:MAG: neutral/alkaline non-lysosomal ceramidase N-terminal domain-containing protein [Anaerolineales bacterium]|jgi:neutral ceramidase
MSDSKVQASVVQVDITPPVGIPMEGYGAREGVSQGVHDPLVAQLLMLEGASRRLILVAADLLGIRLGVTRNLRTAIEQAIGPSDGVMIACSHTHSGPAGFMPEVPGLRTYSDPDFQHFVERKIAGAALQASRQLVPVRLGWGSGRVRGIGTNRNDPDSDRLDDELLILRVDDSEGQPLAVLMNYGCHPTVLGQDNLLLTADFPGAARSILARIFPDTVFLFTNGASGDVSTRFTRREQTFTEAERMGSILAGGVLGTMQKVESRSSATLDCRTHALEVPFREFPPAEESQGRIDELQHRLDAMKAEGASHGDLRRVFTQWQGAVGQSKMRESLAGQSSIQTELQIFHIGEGALMGLPGEPFTQSVLRIKQDSPFLYTGVVSYCNDEIGYFPDAESFRDETYEALISPFQQDVATLIEETSLNYLQEAHHI